jgi:hypothetical protein
VDQGRYWGASVRDNQALLVAPKVKQLTLFYQSDGRLEGPGTVGVVTHACTIITGDQNFTQAVEEWLD